MGDAREIHEAYKAGDLDALREALGNPPDFPNCRSAMGVGEIPLEYAIYHSPLRFIRTLLELGADPDYGDHGGFPSLIAALSSRDGPELHGILELLLEFGADPGQRGVNDWTPLHYAVTQNRDPKAVAILLAHGADPAARTRIDDHATPLEEAEILGATGSREMTEIAVQLRSAISEPST